MQSAVAQRIYSGTTFTDSMQSVWGDDWREALNLMYDKLDNCPNQNAAKVWCSTVHDVKIHHESRSTAYYKPLTNGVWMGEKYRDLTKSGWGKPLQTLFHEVGHATDSKLSGGFKSYDALTKDGELGRVIFKDWGDEIERRSSATIKRYESIWKSDDVYSQLIDNGFIHGCQAGNLDDAREAVRRYMNALSNDEYNRLREMGVRDYDWLLKSTPAQRKKLLPPELCERLDYLIPKKASITAQVKKDAKSSAKNEIFAELKGYDLAVRGDISDWLECLTGEGYP
ncbi:MAG: hypothetical protein EOM77_06200, partial [Bacteroidia bacterium]|nr:hypothetical protein [Bacteroidia bacterium]